MSARFPRILGILLAANLLAAAGCYAPEIGDGTLGCATGGVCPQGFSCGRDLHCWHAPDGANADATGPATSGGGGTVAGHGGTGGGTGGGSAAGSGGTAGRGGAAGGEATGGQAGGRGGAGGGGHGGGSGGSPVADAGVDALAGKPLGAGCAAAGACASGFCVDGVCCDGACPGSCEACDVTPGHCAAVTSGPPHGTRPACGGSGTCAGTCSAGTRTACTFPGNATTCRAQSCSGNALTPAAFCNGGGTCSLPATSTCGESLACNAAGTACLTSCQHDADCLAPLPYCAASTCTAARPAGTTCGSDGQCRSGHCTDGLCCDLACTGQCQACDLSGHLGTCSPIPANEAPHGQRGACAGSGVCGSACNGSATMCVYPGMETACPCSGLLSGTCNGTGTCTVVAGVCA